MKSDCSVRLHCSYYIQGLWFCIFLLKHRFPSLSLKLNGQVCSSSDLQFFWTWEQPVCTPTPSLPSSGSLLRGTCPATGPGLLPACEGGWALLEGGAQRVFLSAASPLPAGPTHWINSVGPGGLRTKWAAPKWAHFIGGGWMRASTISAFLRQGPYKNYKHCMVMKIQLLWDICFTLDFYCCF